MILDPLSIAILFFVLFAWSRAVLRFKEGGIGFKEFFVWTSIWGMVVALILFRDRLGFLTRFTTLQRPIDVILAGSIILLFYLLFRIYVKIDTMDQNVTKIVRELTLQKKK
ncbi:MAG: DUF2304 family protein [Candidatus Woesearchaeota archaeon]|nr:DUF2304 family protein [Candidatus Woesearchaeota archaeon]